MVPRYAQMHKVMPGKLPLLVLVAALVGPGCGQQAPDKAATSAAPTEAPVPPALRVVPKPSLTRADIVSAAAQAASGFAEEVGYAGPDPLVGRSFLVRIPFGCEGFKESTAASGLATWSPSEDGKSIRINLEPADWSQAGLFTTPAALAKWEAVEGFWIPRPWLASETCPQATADATPGLPSVSPQSVGLAAVFERGGSRLGRRDGRAYGFTVRSRDDAPPSAPAAGFTLVLAGRIAAFDDGRAFACTAAGPEQRPVCIAAVQLDRVAFDAGGETLTEWRPG